MSFYSNLATTATSLLTKFGQNITFRDKQTYDPVTGVASGSVIDNVTIGLFQRIPNNIIDGTRIKTGDRLIVIDSSYVPTINQSVVISNTEWSIQEIEEVNPAGTDLVYFVRIRK